MTAVAGAPVVYKNRRGWLIFFGVGLVMFGLMSMGMAALLVVAVLAAANTPEVQQAMPASIMVPVVVMYLGIGAGLILLGAGSFMVRRWAHALTLAVSWLWLIFGLITVVVVIGMMPLMTSTMPPDQAEMFPMVFGCVIVFAGWFMVVVPVTYVLFYRAPSVRATVGTLDPVARWTDGIPTPLLAFAVWMIAGGIIVAMYSFAYQALPFGPWLLRGPVVVVVVVALAALLLFAGIGAIRRRPSAWWAAIALFVIGAVVSGFALANPRLAEMYEAMGMPIEQEEVEMMEQVYKSPVTMAVTAAIWLAYFAYLFYLRRYFFGSERRPDDAAVHLQ